MGAPRPVTGNPLVERERRVIRVHTETIYHVAWNCADAAILHLAHSILCDVGELLQQTLVHRVVHMPVQHIHQRIPFGIHAVLPVIAHDGIVAEHHLPLAVMQLLVRLDLHKPVGVVFLVFQETVVISLDEEQPTVQLF